MKHYRYQCLLVFLLLGVSLSLSSCKGDIFNEQVEQSGERAHSGLLDNQLQSVEEMFSQMGCATRSPRKIGSVEYVATKPTRAQSADTILSLINFSDDEGFALVSTTNPVDIYALSPEGHMTLEDMRSQDLLLGYLGRSIIEEHRVRTRAEEGPFDSIKAEVVAYVAPMLDKRVAKWNQLAPYNMYCPEDAESGQRCPVGCGPLSVGMVLSYYKWPSRTMYPGVGIENNIFFSWGSMLPNTNKVTYELVAEMLYFVGSKILDAKYSVKGTSVTKSKIRIGMCRIAYEDEFGFDFLPIQGSQEKVATFFKYGLSLNGDTIKPGPVIVQGLSNYEEHLGHQWVIDALVVRGMIAYSGGVRLELSRKEYFFRCIWGWENYNLNGYYRFLDSLDIGDPQQYIPLLESFDIIGEKASTVLTDAYCDWEIFGGFKPMR